MVVFSSDVEAMYPSLQRKSTAVICARLLRENSLSVEGVDWGDASIYLAVIMFREIVEDVELGEVVPVWRKASTARCAPPDINTKEMKGLLQQEKDLDKSFFFQPSREPTKSEQRLIISLCPEERLLTAMENHHYLFNKEIRRQEDGLVIGAHLAGVAAKQVLLD